MTSGVLSPEVRRQRRLAKMAAFFQEADEVLGEETSVTVEQLDEISRKKGSPDELILEAEAVLLYYQLKGQGFTKQVCPTCNRQFAHKYWIKGGKLNCSNECRAAALDAIGIKWNPLKTVEERWGLKDGNKGRLPLIVPPVALPLIEEILEKEQREHSSPVPPA